MKTRRELKHRFDTRLKLAKNSTIFSDLDKNMFVNDAIAWVQSQHKWSQREMCASYVLGTQAGDGYYDYPNSPVAFAPMSIKSLVIDGHEYQQKDYHDLMKLKRANIEVGDKKYFANFGTWFFIYPVIKADGLPIHVTGVVQASRLNSDDEKTIWADDMEELNEAVIEMMLFYATGKGEHLALAQQIVSVVWAKFVAERQKDVPIDRPFLKIPDFFRS